MVVGLRAPCRGVMLCSGMTELAPQLRLNSEDGGSASQTALLGPREFGSAGQQKAGRAGLFLIMSRALRLFARPLAMSQAVG